MENESVHEKLDDVREHIQRDRSVLTWLWRGILFGIGSTLGVALIFYVFLLIAQQLSGVPILGAALKRLEPLVKQTAESRVPNVENLVPAVPSESSPTEQPSADQPATTQPERIETTDFTLTLPEGWTRDRQDARQSQSEPFVATVIATSPDFQVTVDDAGVETAYKAGARLTVVIAEDAGKPIYENIVSQHQQRLAGEMAIYTVWKPDQLTAGELVTLELLHRGLAYTITFAYNPSVFTKGQATFDSILESFAFTE